MVELVTAAPMMLRPKMPMANRKKVLPSPLKVPAL